MSIKMDASVENCCRRVAKSRRESNGLAANAKFQYDEDEWLGI